MWQKQLRDEDQHYAIPHLDTIAEEEDEPDYASVAAASSGAGSASRPPNSMRAPRTVDANMGSNLVNTRVPETIAEESLRVKSELGFSGEESKPASVEPDAGLPDEEMEEGVEFP